MKPTIIAASAGSITALRADEAGDHAAAVDVADQHDRHVGGAGEAHVGDVAGAQVDLGGRARAFDQHEVALRPRGVPKLSSTAPSSLGFSRLVFARLGVADDLALHDDLRADLALGLQQHRVHVHARAARARRAPAAPGRGRSRRRRR